jgi:hypothetical protein
VCFSHDMRPPNLVENCPHHHINLRGVTGLILSAGMIAVFRQFPFADTHSAKEGVYSLMPLHEWQP